MAREGDIVWVDLDPIRGTEQAGRRPALIVSETRYNAPSTRAVVCPISTRAKPWAFNVPLPPSLATRGMVLVDQVRALHQESRFLDPIEQAPPELLRAVR